MSPSVPLSALRPLWWGLPLVPGLASFLPWFAPALSWTWFLVLFYAAPGIELARAAGFAPARWWLHVFPLVSGLALGLLLELAVRAVARRGGAWRPIRRRTAAGVATASVAIALGAVGWRYAQWIDWPSQQPRDLYLLHLPELDATVRVLRVYEMPRPGLLDRLSAVRLGIEPDSLPELIRALELQPVPESSIPDDFWSAPGAWWWRPPREGRFHASPGFSFTERVPSGDHYLVMEVPGDDQLWGWHRHRIDLEQLMRPLRTLPPPDLGRASP